MDEFLQHVKQQASPVIARQIGCVLQHWHELDAVDQEDGSEAGSDADDQLDDDPQDAHSHLGTGSDEAETIHSWGTACEPVHHQHCVSCLVCSQE